MSGVQVGEDGQSDKQRTEALKSMGIEVDDEIKPPHELLYLYDMFFSMRFSLVFNGDDRKLQPRQSLTSYDINYYDKNNELDLQAWEVDVIFSLDATYNKAVKWNQN